MKKGGLPAEILAAADLDGTGRLDLIARDTDGQLHRLSPIPTKQYHWQETQAKSLRGCGSLGHDFFLIGKNLLLVGQDALLAAKMFTVVPVDHFPVAILLQKKHFFHDRRPGAELADGFALGWR